MKVYKNTVIGAERSPLPIQNWGAVTRKGNTLYLHVFDWPADQKLVVGGLENAIVSTHLLSGKERIALTVERLNAMDVRIAVPKQAPHPADSVIEAVFEGEPVVSKVRLLDPAALLNRLHVFDSDLHDGVRFLDGKKNRDCTVDWKDAKAVIAWTVRVNTPVAFDLRLVSVAGTGGGGTYELKVDEQVFSGTVSSGSDETAVGKIRLDAGEHQIRIRPLAAESSEAIQLRCIDMFASR